jgi:hypothetical protein
MPPLERMDFHDRAMMWEVQRYDRHGNQLVAEPVELRCRWEEKQIEMLDDQGQRIVVDVILATTQNIPNGSLMWEGSEEDLEDEVGTGLVPTDNIYEVIARDRGKDLKGRVTRYEFGLKRFKDVLPDRV